jgi:hypothetical protein
MSLFEFYTVLLSLVISIGLATLLGATLRLIQDADRVVFSLPHAVWSLAVFLQQLGFWLKAWSYNVTLELTAAAFFLPVILAVLAFACCSLVTPHIPETGQIDLRAFHQRQGPKYAIAMALYMSIAVVQFLVMDPITKESLIRCAVMAAQIVVALAAARFGSLAWLQLTTPILLLLVNLQFILELLAGFSQA